MRIFNALKRKTAFGRESLSPIGDHGPNLKRNNKEFNCLVGRIDCSTKDINF